MMPQLMPLMWIFSFLMVLLFLVMMMIMFNDFLIFGLFCDKVLIKKYNTWFW